MSPHLPRRPLRAATAGSLALLLGLALAACGGGNSSSGSGGPASQSTQDGQKLAAVWPLTGLPAGNTTPDHPALVVKIPNTSEAQPQVGMSQADLAYEELVEGGITRLGVFFYSRIPASVGPVRSMRTSDIGIVKSAKAAIVASGAAPPVLGSLNRAHVRYFTESGPGYYRVGDRVSPYNLMVHLRDLAKTLRKHATVPENYFDWGKASDFNGKLKARSIAARFSSYRTSEWRYQGGRYVNTNSYAPANDQFKPDTVIVVRVREGVARYRDPAGNPVPITLYDGKGAMVMFHGGRAIRGTWSKPNGDSRVTFSTKAGPLSVPPGHVFLELVPVDRDGGHLSWGK